MAPLHLAAGAYALVVEPEEGGAVARFEFEGEPLFRPRCGSGPLNSACFPLVPFSNRIARGRFEADGRLVSLAPNLPGSDHPHTLHGFAWLKRWEVAAKSASSAVLAYDHAADEWPWAFEAVQEFELNEVGLCHTLSIRNKSETPMPAGLGAHPYFPRTQQTTYEGLHRGEWETSVDGLPVRLHLASAPIDWWRGRPIDTRNVDTIYTGREGSLLITWPERCLALTITPDEALSFTVVYTPANANFFCVEPVSHETDAVNRACDATGLRWLAPGDTFSADIFYAARRLPTAAGSSNAPA